MIIIIIIYSTPFTLQSTPCFRHLHGIGVLFALQNLEFVYGHSHRRWDIISMEDVIVKSITNSWLQFSILINKEICCSKYIKFVRQNISKNICKLEMNSVYIYFNTFEQNYNDIRTMLRARITNEFTVWPGSKAQRSLSKLCSPLFEIQSYFI